MLARPLIVAVIALGITVVDSARAQVSDNVVKLGVLTDMSSLYSEGTGKGSLIAVQMAVADFGGTVLGKPIEVIGGDHQNKPDIGSSIARQWYDQEKSTPLSMCRRPRSPSRCSRSPERKTRSCCSRAQAARI